MNIQLNQALGKLQKKKRIALANVPTALEKLTRFGPAIGLKNLWIKRDDNTGLALGGNKARKLEYLVGEALKQKCNILFTVGGIQSNHVRMTAAAAKKYGMDCHIWLLGTKPSNVTGNVLLDKLLGATIEYFPPMTDDELEQRAAVFMKRMHAEGKRPFYIPIGGSTGIGSLGYVVMIQELADQLKKNKLKLDTILTTTGSGGTQAGIIMGCHLFLSKTRVIGISVNRKKEVFIDKIGNILGETEKILGIKTPVPKDKIIVYDDYIGERYGVPTQEAIDVIYQLAQTEGILLDPVYTGKAMAGLVGLAKKGIIKPGEKILFVHTGGVPAIFAYESTFSK